MSIEEQLSEAAASNVSGSATPNVDDAEPAHPSTTLHEAEPAGGASRKNSSSGTDFSQATVLSVHDSNESDQDGSVPLMWSKSSVHSMPERQPAYSDGTLTPSVPPNSVHSNLTPSTTGTLISVPQAAVPPFPPQEPNNDANSNHNRAMINALHATRRNPENAMANFQVPQNRPRRIYPLSGREEGGSARRQLEYRVMQWNEASERVA